MSELITFRLSPDHARALVALGADHTAPALARAAADLVWQQISGPAPVTDAPRRSAPARTLRPLPGVDYGRWDDSAPLPTARACKLLNLLTAAGAADPIGMARALTGRDITAAEQITECEGMQLLDIQNHRRAQLAAAQQQAQQPAPAPLLTRTQARALHKQLAGIWETDERYTQAAKIARRPVESLTALNQDEAAALLVVAKAEQEARDRAAVLAQQDPAAYGAALLR
nr:hypothetical protein [Shuttle vector pI3]UVZ00224.1 Hypothetical protein [synthetic construct]